MVPRGLFTWIQKLHNFWKKKKGLKSVSPVPIDSTGALELLLQAGVQSLFANHGFDAPEVCIFISKGMLHPKCEDCAKNLLTCHFYAFFVIDISERKCLTAK